MNNNNPDSSSESSIEVTLQRPLVIRPAAATVQEALPERSDSEPSASSLSSEDTPSCVLRIVVEAQAENVTIGRVTVQTLHTDFPAVRVCVEEEGVQQTQVRDQIGDSTLVWSTRQRPWSFEIDIAGLPTPRP